jgi:polysaccharide pyruvyl transferase WcaK-like protein
MKISVLGWYNHGNVGDEAFKMVFPLLLPSHKVRCVEGLKDDDDSDGYILGGGDVVYDAYMKYLRKFPDKPKIAASVTLTPNSSLDELAVFDRVYVRDEMSLALGQQHVDKSKISYLPDVSFALHPDPVAGRDWLEEAFSAAGLELYEKVVVCVVSSYTAFNKGDSLSRDFINFLNVADILSAAADNHSASFVFLPFSTMAPNDDRMSNAFVGGRVKFYRKNYVVYQKLSVQTTLDVLSCAQAVISTRLHSTIFSAISGVPFIDLTHHDKNLGFIRTLGKPEWSVPLWDFSSSSFNRLLGGFVDGRVPDQSLVDFTNKSRDQLESLVLYP